MKLISTFNFILKVRQEKSLYRRIMEIYQKDQNMSDSSLIFQQMLNAFDS